MQTPKKPPLSPRVTRRDIARLAVGSALGAVAAGCQLPPPTPPSNVPSETPKMPDKTVSLADPRLTQLEKAHGSALSAPQRKRLAKSLSDIDSTCDALRKFALQDGGSEPNTLFHPTPAEPTQPSARKADA